MTFSNVIVGLANPGRQIVPKLRSSPVAAKLRSPNRVSCWSVGHNTCRCRPIVAGDGQRETSWQSSIRLWETSWQSSIRYAAVESRSALIIAMMMAAAATTLPLQSVICIGVLSLLQMRCDDDLSDGEDSDFKKALRLSLLGQFYIHHRQQLMMVYVVFVFIHIHLIFHLISITDLCSSSTMKFIDSLTNFRSWRHTFIVDT